MDPATGAFLGALIGSGLTLLGNVLAPWSNAFHERRRRRDEAQARLLRRLQKTMRVMSLAAGRVHNERLEAHERGIDWIQAEPDQQRLETFREAGALLTVLRVRAKDERLRESIDKFRLLATDVVFSKSKEAAYPTVVAMTGVFLQTNEDLGRILRGLE